MLLFFDFLSFSMGTREDTKVEYECERYEFSHLKIVLFIKCFFVMTIVCECELLDCYMCNVVMYVPTYKSASFWYVECCFIHDVFSP
jgi:hypothetical protein